MIAANNLQGTEWRTDRAPASNVQDFDLHPIHGFEGFLVIESDLSLDVVAVYTAGKNGDGGVESIDVEYIRERAIP